MTLAAASARRSALVKTQGTIEPDCLMIRQGSNPTRPTIVQVEELSAAAFSKDDRVELSLRPTRGGELSGRRRGEPSDHQWGKLLAASGENELALDDHDSSLPDADQDGPSEPGGFQ